MDRAARGIYRMGRRVRAMTTIIITNPATRLRALDAVRGQTASVDSPLIVTIDRYRSKRSSDQNRRMWAMLRDIAEQVRPRGDVYATETWHHYFRERFLPHEDVRLPNGQVLSMAVSTTTLSTKDFADYMTQVEAWAAEHGVEWAEW